MPAQRKRQELYVEQHSAWSFPLAVIFKKAGFLCQQSLSSDT
jgi:hypothetical protein